MEYNKLTLLFNQVKRFSYPYKENEIPKNGIYVMFEKGEKHSNLDRVVRIGSHTGQNRLFERINEHYIGEDHRDSIFRKHLGRCFLTIDKRVDYIKCWDLKIKKREDQAKNLDKINWALEEKYEEKISEFIKSNFTFIIIPNLTDEVNRSRIEAGLIAAFAQGEEKSISENWLGRFHPDKKISNSGLWNIQGINGSPLTVDEIKMIENKLQTH
ncbi:MAG: hypothetical protein H7296_08040 [Bacteroidia bacterium]|nr:hypothetical protein [Bacteroidia bacterium]